MCFSKRETTLAREQRLFFGADDEARTRYLHLGKVALYQMSYIRILRVKIYPWCLRSESNQRHEDFQSSALPTELQRHTSNECSNNIQQPKYFVNRNS